MGTLNGRLLKLCRYKDSLTYTSISSDSDGRSWGIPLVNASELPEMDLYTEVAQQGQAPQLSPAYVPDPMELDGHVPVYDLEPEYPEYHVSSDDDMQVEDQPIGPTDYPVNRGDDDDEPSNDDDDDDTNDEDEEPTKDEDDDEEEEHLALADFSAVPVVDPVPSARDTEAYETDESAPTPRSPHTRVPFSQTRLCKARITVRLEPPMSASMEERIDEHAATPIPPTNAAYDQALLAQGLICSPGHDVQTIARAADRAEDVGYAKALQAFEHRMMTSIEEVNLRISYQAQVRRHKSEDFYTQLHDARTNRRDIRLEIDVVRGQRTAYETELHERPSAEDLAVRQMMRIQVLEARAQIDTVEDTSSSFIIIISICIDIVITSHDDASQSSGGELRRPMQPARVCSCTDFMKCQPLKFKGTEGVVGLSQWLEKMESRFHISGCAVDNQVKFATCTLLCAALTWWNGHVRTLGHNTAYAMTWEPSRRSLQTNIVQKRFQELALMCTKFLTDETKKVDKYISGISNNIYGNVMFARPATLDDAIELANDLMDQKLRTYAERHNDNKRKADDLSRNNQQERPHKSKM
nr:hypothetical protein [Tanacetum cinerariifolium]